MRDAAAATKQQDTKKIKSYEMTVPKKTAPLILLSSFILAFNLGRVSRSFLIAPGAPTFSEDRLKLLGKLPVPTLKEGIKITDSRIYNTSKSSQWIIAEETACVAEKQESREADVDEETVDEEDFEDEEGLSKGQQLMLDFKYVSKKFLDSAERLTKAMIEVLKENDLDLLSYHCYKLEPEGINCQFALLKGRVSFTTWPRNGVMAMDIFLLSSSDEDKKLSISIMPSFEKTFSIAENRKKPADMYWILKQRGFNEGDSSEGDILASSDMDHWPLASACTYKKHVASVNSMFQTIDVFDVSLVDRPFEDYQKSLSNDKTSYHAQHPELFAPDRIVFMGGLLQSRRLGDASYHEALVHPGLFAHKSPKRVAIIGGGEGATLREILKHDTIEQVVMIDIDKMIVEISKEYLPQWSDCSNLVGRSDSCFEDAKAEVYLEDAFKWFKDRFLEDGELVGSEDPFDVIIMDALDPQGLTEFVANLYTDKFFYESLYRGLADDGILVAQLGASRSLNDPPEDHSVDRFRLKYIEGLADAGFKATREYAEGACGFGLPWLFTVSFKQRQDEFAWFAPDAEMDVKIRTRAVPTIDSKSPFHYFDSASMRKYKYPPKTSALVHCRRDPLPKGCTKQSNFPSQKIQVLPFQQQTMVVNQGKYGEWYKDAVDVYDEDHLRQTGNEFTYNPYADRQVVFSEA